MFILNSKRYLDRLFQKCFFLHFRSLALKNVHIEFDWYLDCLFREMLFLTFCFITLKNVYLKLELVPRPFVPKFKYWLKYFVPLCWKMFILNSKRYLDRLFWKTLFLHFRSFTLKNVHIEFDWYLDCLFRFVPKSGKKIIWYFRNKTSRGIKKGGNKNR